MSAAVPTVRIDPGSRPATPICGVPRCDNPAPHGVVCTNCLAELRRDLRELAGSPAWAAMLWRADEQRAADERRGLLAELQITLTRQDACGGEHIPEPPEEHRDGDGPGAAATVLLFRPRASAAGRRIHDVVEFWARALLGGLGIHERHAFGRPAPWGAPGPNVWTLEYAAWLERHPDGIASHLQAGELVEDIRGAIEDARRVVFPRQLSYCGPCECGEQMYAGVGKSTVRCRACRRQWVIADRMAALREQAKGLFLTAEDMSRALPRIASDIAIRPLTASQIRGFAFRGRLTQHPPVKDGADPRYKVGEVVDLMLVLLKEKQDREARHAAKTSSTTHTRIVAAHERFREALQA